MVHDPRIVIYTKPRRGRSASRRRRSRPCRFKLYVLWQTTQRRDRRIAVHDQPFHGYATLAEATAQLRALLADGREGLEIAHAINSSGGTKPPADEEIVSTGGELA